MKAIGVWEYGGPERLEEIELPDPEPGEGEVRIRVHAATVNPTDTLLRAGVHAKRLGDRKPPFVPGMDAAGVLEAVGPGVDGRLRVGQRVIALVVPTGPHGGAYAERIVLPAASVVPAPTGADLPAASTLLMNALTARMTLDALALAPGDTVAVTGAAGTLGGYVIQLAKADGLRVVADAKPADEALVRELGADHVVARGDGVTDRIRSLAPGGVPGLVDAAVLNEAVFPAIADGGGLATIRGWRGPGERGIRVHPVLVSERATDTDALDRLRRQVEEGALTLRVADVLPAARAGEAHRRLAEGGVRGRLVLDFS
ncbi:NADP-dependent oxidoreductase [Pseudonocardia eucalypti]|uniref:NADP-dependent oxidoreductase n=1 Tax=Pseudonocardia eucalypti TaxID=648755 RepID=A0ABP9PS15_9PSEU|nr:NADPH:quinone reductase-like Zn-dependent oxidoreductase [Pseudonocardia eucalypti]